MFALGL